MAVRLTALRTGRHLPPGRFLVLICVLDLGISWRWVVSFTPRPLYPLGKSPCYTIDRRLGEPQSRFVRCDEEKILTLPGLELRPLDRRPARSQSLYRLSYLYFIQRVTRHLPFERELSENEASGSALAWIPLVMNATQRHNPCSLVSQGSGILAAETLWRQTSRRVYSSLMRFRRSCRCSGL
jgi:hypothetical protein